MASLLLTCVRSLNRKCFPRQISKLSSLRSQGMATIRPSFTFQPVVKSPDHYTKYHEVPAENWKYVERLQPQVFVPESPVKESYPSGWTPPPKTAPNLPYFVNRTRNGMLPIYLNFEEVRDMRKITTIRLIEGDIWALKEELLKHLQNLKPNTIVGQVHEVGMFIKFKGDHVLAAKNWLLKKGF